MEKVEAELTKDATAETIFKATAEQRRSKRKSTDMDPSVRCQTALPIIKDACSTASNHYFSLHMELLENRLCSLDDGTREIVLHDIDNLVFRARLNANMPFVQSMTGVSPASNNGTVSTKNDPYTPAPLNSSRLDKLW